MRSPPTRRLRFVVAVVALCSSAACVPSVTVKEATLQRATAGLIGCPSSDIRISGQPRTVKAGDGPVEWRAECRGRRYVCSGAGNGASCTPELEPSTKASP